MKIQLKKSYYQDISAWLLLILAAHRVQLRGVRRKSPSWWFVWRPMPLQAKPKHPYSVFW